MSYPVRVRPFGSSLSTMRLSCELDSVSYLMGQIGSLWSEKRAMEGKHSK